MILTPVSISPTIVAIAPPTSRSAEKPVCSTWTSTTSQLLLPHQTHTNRVALVDEALMETERSERNRHLRDIDALVTALPRVCIGISTADCVPVLLYDPKHRVIGAAHAGWRGMVSHILVHTIERMRTLGTHPRDLRAVVGPCIGPDSFEVGEEVVDAFLQAKFPPAVVRRGFFRRHTSICGQRQCMSSNKAVCRWRPFS